MNKEANLFELVDGIDIEQTLGRSDNNCRITKLCFSAQACESGALFFAVKGNKVDGRQFIADAFARGAVAVIADSEAFEHFGDYPGPVMLVSNLRETKALVARRFFLGNVEPEISIGVTGTNGKTSVCWILSQALTSLGYPCAYIGTLGSKYRYANNVIDLPGNTTTPDSVEVFSFIAHAMSMGAKALSMEVSSHAIHQHRVGGINWDCAVLTNVTRDHLDYHKTIEEYARVKKLLFLRDLAMSSKTKRLAVINAEDRAGEDLLLELSAKYPRIKLLAFGTKEGNNRIVGYKAGLLSTKVSYDLEGDLVEFETSLVGNYNVTNMLMAASVLHGLGYRGADIEKSLTSVTPVPGRLERVANAKVAVFVDYAHTPDALVRAQQSLREITKGRLITVFGCGGDRDRGKRPIMAQEVMRVSDLAVVTSDNPRTEDPERIVSDITAGLSESDKDNRYFVEIDRRKAIRNAVGMAKAGDVILVAGKGHEDYQEIHGIKHHLSDQEECYKALKDVGLV